MNLRRRVSLIVFFISLISGSALFSSEPTWQGSYYANHSKVQFDVALKALSLINIPQNATVLDIGCGDGKITQHIANSIKNGYVIGIDHSHSMIESAQQHAQSNLTFINRDATNLDLHQQFDYIVSFCCLHWVEDIEKALTEIREALTPHGKALVAICPQQHIHQVINDIAFSSDWKENFTGTTLFPTFFSTDSWKQHVVNVGLSIEEWQTETVNYLFSNKAEFTQFLEGWVPSPMDKKEIYFNEIGECYITKTPNALQPNSSLIYTFQMLTFVVTK